ncbi:hypothetical protein ACRARG_04845 [Pseudooceanicola sp. C21-150M6]|uniref:hypothetical protein n=1 Tax=Pseudooceanicola sp. C21-150M6 TaxID=3434355 RepID=UPI003D7F55FF
MTADQLDRVTSTLISDITAHTPGYRHQYLDRVHEVMGAYSRAGLAAPGTMRRLLEELTAEAVETGYDRMSV